MPQECINIYMAHLLALNIWLIMDIVKKLGMTPKEIILNFFEIGILFSVLIINHGLDSGGGAWRMLLTSNFELWETSEMCHG